MLSEHAVQTESLRIERDMRTKNVLAKMQKKKKKKKGPTCGVVKINHLHDTLNRVVEIVKRYKKIYGNR